MACSKYASTRQTTHAARMSRLLFGPCTDLLRDVLRQHIPETSFPVTLQSRRVKGRLFSLRNLQAAQRELLYPHVGTFRGSYADFDISLLYLLLRNIINIAPHRNDWGSPPDQTDRSVSANIDRIRMIRNQIGARYHRHDLSDAVFSTAWAKLKRSVIDIVRGTIGISTNYEQIINDLANEPMDPDREDYWLELLQKQIQDDAEKYEEIVKNVKSVQEKIKGISNEQDKQRQIQKNQGETQTEHGAILTEHADRLTKQGEIQTKHGTTMAEHEDRLNKQDEFQIKHGVILKEHEDQLKKQGEVQKEEEAILREHDKRLSNQEEALHQEAKNILDNTKAVLQNHKSSKTYIRTEQVDTVIRKLHEQNIIILTGKPGDGKTTIAKQVLWELSKDGEYVPVKITTQEQWDKVVISSKKMAVHIDDIFGSTNFHRRAIEKWKKMFDLMTSSANEGKTFVLICSRSNILSEARKLCNEHFLSPEYENNIASNGLSSKEKKNMLLQYEKVFEYRTSELIGDGFRKYETWHEKDAVYKLSNWQWEAIIESEPYYGFPQTCFLFFARKEFFQLGENFFLRPNNTLFESIDNMRKSTDIRTKMQYCTLAYVFLQEYVHLRDLKEDVFQEICEKSSLQKWTEVDVEDSVQDLEGIYLSPSNQTHVFTFSHVTILEAVAASFGKLAPDIVIQKCSHKILEELIRTEGYEARDGEVILTIRKRYYPLLANRLLTEELECEDTEHSEYTAVDHPSTDDAEFSPLLLDVINMSPHYSRKSIEDIWYNLQYEDKPALYKEILIRHGPHHIKYKGEYDSDVSVDEHDSDTSVERSYLIKCEEVKDHLHNHFYNGHKQTVLVIIRYVFSNCDVNYFLNSYDHVFCYIRGMSILHCCVARGWTDVVDEILNVVTPTKTENNWSCLHFAAFFGRFELFKKFEKLSSNVLETTRDGYNILQVVLLGLRYGVNKSCYHEFYLSVSDTYFSNLHLWNISLNETDFTNIVQHVMTGYPSLITSLDMPLDDYNNNIIHYLVIHDRQEIYDMLVNKKKDLIFHSNDTELPTTLYLAAYLGRVKFVEKLWKAGVRAEVANLSIAKCIECGQEHSDTTVTEADKNEWLDQHFRFVNNIKIKCMSPQPVRFGCTDDFNAISSICIADN